MQLCINHFHSILFPLCPSIRFDTLKSSKVSVGIHSGSSIFTLQLSPVSSVDANAIQPIQSTAAELRLVLGRRVEGYLVDFRKTSLRCCCHWTGVLAYEYVDNRCERYSPPQCYDIITTGKINHIAVIKITPFFVVETVLVCENEQGNWNGKLCSLAHSHKLKLCLW